MVALFTTMVKLCKSGLINYNAQYVLGQPKLWHMMNVMGAARHFAHHHPLDDTGRTFRDFLQMTDDRFTFMVTSELEYFPELYDPDIQKNNLRVHTRGGYIGTSSTNTHSDAYTCDGKTLLMKNITQIVSIDKTSRRPTPLPEWWRNKYAKAAEGQKSLRFDDFGRPESNVFCDVRRVAWSDTDAYKHTNWSSYARFCVDAAHLFSMEGKLKHFTDNIENGLQRVELTYIGECLHGDTLHIHVWEDGTNTKCLYFDICRNDKSIFKSRFFYH